MRCRRRIDRSFVIPFALRRLRRPQPRLTIPARRLPVSFAYADLQARRAIHDSQIAGYRFTHRAARRHRAPLVMRSRHARVPFAPPGWFCAVACCRLPRAINRLAAWRGGNRRRFTSPPQYRHNSSSRSAAERIPAAPHPSHHVTSVGRSSGPTGQSGRGVDSFMVARLVRASVAGQRGDSRGRLSFVYSFGNDAGCASACAIPASNSASRAEVNRSPSGRQRMISRAAISRRRLSSGGSSRSWGHSSMGQQLHAQRASEGRASGSRRCD